LSSSNKSLDAWKGAAFGSDITLTGVELCTLDSDGADDDNDVANSGSFNPDCWFSAFGSSEHHVFVLL